MLKQAIPVLHISSADAAEAFYCQILGFRREFRVPASETKRDPCYMGLSRDGAILHLSSHAGDGVTGGVVYFLADDVDALYAEFTVKNASIPIATVDAAGVHGPVNQTWGMRELYVRDPDGNSIRFGAPIP